MFIKLGSAFGFAFVLSTFGCSAPGESVDDGTVEISSRSAHFETFVGEDGKTYFDLVAANGENVLRSQGYASSSGAKNGEASIVANGSDPQAFDLLEASDGTWYFNLTAKNNQIIGTSQMYVTKSDATRGASTVRALVLLLGENPESINAVHQERFEVFTGEDKKFYFHLRAGNGEIVLGSQGYTAKASAIAGIASVESNGVVASRWQTFTAIDGEYGIRLVAGNGQTIGAGELYTTKESASDAVATISAMLASSVTVYAE
jgi:hypothetical protein